MISNNLWESSSSQFNCNLCASDEPFFMPLNRIDLVGLRLQIPYQYVTQNGGSLPIGANVELSIVDEVGTTTLCSLSTANNGRFILGKVNDATNKVAQYQIYTPIPLRDGSNIVWTHYYFTATKGDHINITGDALAENECDFIYGYDSLPENFYEVAPGYIVVPGRTLTANTTNVLTKNGTTTSLTLLYTTATACTHEQYQCFRFKLSVTYSTWGETKDFYTKPFRIERCTESLKIQGKYTSGMTDCVGYKHSASFNVGIIGENNLILRLPADIETAPNFVRNSYNDRCYKYKTEVQRAYRLKSDPMPSWLASEVENIIASQEFKVNNFQYISESELIFEESDVESSKYQNINLSLLSCKCEKVFVC